MGGLETYSMGEEVNLKERKGGQDLGERREVVSVCSMISSAPTSVDPPSLGLPGGPPAASCNHCLLHSLPGSLPFQPRGSGCALDSQLLPKPAKSEAALGFGKGRIASRSSQYPSCAQSEVLTHLPAVVWRRLVLAAPGLAPAQLVRSLWVWCYHQRVYYPPPSFCAKLYLVLPERFLDCHKFSLLSEQDKELKRVV